jgi:hypothetical protein
MAVYVLGVGNPRNFVSKDWNDLLIARRKEDSLIKLARSKLQVFAGNQLELIGDLDFLIVSEQIEVANQNSRALVDLLLLLGRESSLRLAASHLSFASTLLRFAMAMVKAQPASLLPDLE